MKTVNIRVFLFVGLFFISVSQINRDFTTNENIWIQSVYMNMHNLFMLRKPHKQLKAWLGEEK